MKRILIISNMFPSPAHPTFGIFVKNQVNLLNHNGIETAVISNGNPDKGKLNLLKKYFSWFMRYVKYMGVNHKKVSAVHAHYLFPTGLLAMLSKKIWNVPYVVTAHGGDLDQMPNKSNFIRKMTTAILKNADDVIVVGEALKENVLSLYPVDANHLHVISMGVNTEIFKPLPVEEYQQLIPVGKSPSLLYVGNIIRAKGLLELAEAFKKVQSKFPDASLYLAGSRKDEAFTEELKDKIHQLNLSSVHFLDPMPQQDIAKWMNAADVLVLPSHIEGFGLVALEGMASGIPVVGSEVGGLAHLLADGRGLLFEKGNSEMLAQKVLEILTMKDQLIDQEEIQKAVDENSFEAILEKLLRIYEGMSPSNE